MGVITERAIAKVLTAPFEGALPSDSDMVSATMSLEALVRHRMDAEAVKPTDGVLSSLVQDLEREVYRQAWERTHGNQSRVATLLGLSRATVHEKLERYRLLLKDS